MTGSWNVVSSKSSARGEDSQRPYRLLRYEGDIRRSVVLALTLSIMLIMHMDAPQKCKD
ncbi:hypothetical protein SERLA73DRAFT_178626 [Serpula lacrymans var. lacrymans S7.3]|uniref:Uncharacterized protein n=1 Tax=Serpula lacrymans var. lacrymans (strain S7.3) TaxID=936435 RepID=F8PSA7_SERL3|nr:hypothetical protein SERLA73DRAFT_178626 [Serpula lacrymans var. lacrymans S7.3]